MTWGIHASCTGCSCVPVTEPSPRPLGLIDAETYHVQTPFDALCSSSPHGLASSSATWPRSTRCFTATLVLSALALGGLLGSSDVTHRASDHRIRIQQPAATAFAPLTRGASQARRSAMPPEIQASWSAAEHPQIYVGPVEAPHRSAASLRATVGTVPRPLWIPGAVTFFGALILTTWLFVRRAMLPAVPPVPPLAMLAASGQRRGGGDGRSRPKGPSPAQTFLMIAQDQKWRFVYEFEQDPETGDWKCRLKTSHDDLQQKAEGLVGTCAEEMRRSVAITSLVEQLLLLLPAPQPRARLDSVFQPPEICVIRSEDDACALLEEARAEGVVGVDTEGTQVTPPVVVQMATRERVYVFVAADESGVRDKRAAAVMADATVVKAVFGVRPVTLNLHPTTYSVQP